MQALKLTNPEDIHEPQNLEILAKVCHTLVPGENWTCTRAEDTLLEFECDTLIIQFKTTLEL